MLLTKAIFIHDQISEVFMGSNSHSHLFKSCGHTLHFLNRKEAHIEVVSMLDLGVLRYITKRG